MGFIEFVCFTTGGGSCGYWMGTRDLNEEAELTTVEGMGISRFGDFVSFLSLVRK